MFFYSCQFQTFESVGTVFIKFFNKFQNLLLKYILLYTDFHKDIRNEKFLTENRQCFFSSKSFLNFGGPSTKFLINEFLIKKKCVYIYI